MDNMTHKEYETAYKFTIGWQRVKELLDSLQDKKISRNGDDIHTTLFQFYITQNKEKNSPHKVLFHFLFLIGLEASDALPSSESVRYHAAHIVWKADESISTKMKNFSKKCKKAKKAIYENAIMDLNNNPEIPFFISHKYWKHIQEKYFKISESVPNAIENERLIIELLILKRNGECIQGKSPHLPPLYARKAFCKDATIALCLANVQRTILFQSPCKADDKSFFLSTTNQVQTVPPLHVGWTEEFEYPFFYGMNLWDNCATEYGNAFIRHNHKQPNPFAYHRLLEIVPPETAIPLLAYSLFSIIKFFIPGYPSRISADEPFRIVNKKMDKLIFLSLKGEDAETLADAFCGAFSDYGEEYKNIDWRYRVHDGVVIYNKKFKNLNQFRTHELLQDACVLCINPDFEQNDQEIILQTDVKLTAEEYQEVREIIEDLLFLFAKIFNIRCIMRLKQIMSGAKHYLKLKYVDLYNEILKLLPFIENIAFTPTEALRIICQADTRQELKKAGNMLIYPLRKAIRQESQEDNTSYDYSYNDSYNYDEENETIISNCENLIKNFIEECAKTIREGQERFYNEIYNQLELTKSLSRENLENKNHLLKYTYLYGGIVQFCTILEKYCAISENDARYLRNQSLRIIKNMTKEQGNGTAPQQVLNQYLSSKITKQHIIPVRTQSDTEISGWYDSKKDLIYLPYKTYFDSINQYWKEQNHISLPYEQKAFQAALSKDGILRTTKNGKNNYDRPDYKIVVAPADSGTQYKETVIKIQVDRLSLSKSAQDRLEELSKVPVKRRSRSE